MMQSEWQSNRFPSFVWNNDGKYTHANIWTDFNLPKTPHANNLCSFQFSWLDPENLKMRISQNFAKIATIESNDRKQMEN